MNKIWLILLREFSIRVRKKSFLLTTILVPLIFPAIMAGMFYLMVEEEKSSGPDIVMVANESGTIKLTDTEEFAFQALNVPLEQAKETFRASESFALLYIPEFDLQKPAGFTLFTSQHASAEQVDALERILDDQIRDLRFKAWDIDEQRMQSLREKVRLGQVSLSPEGEETQTNSGILSAAGMLLGIVIYMMVVLYGVQIMQGVIEEKSSRIVEIIISSVRPFQLMLGKILGIGSVGMIQFVIWVVLLFSVTSTVNGYFADKLPKTEAVQQMDAAAAEAEEGPAVQKIMDGIGDLPLLKIAVLFLFYFLGGYFLYGALFAAVGAAVESVQDAQQFQFPVTIPLLIGYLGLFTFVLRDPHSTVSFWLSVIPFTSPVCMVGRVAFGVPWYELALSMVLLVLGFLGTTWLAGRVYRIGILTTGAKVDWKTLMKWVVMKD